MPIYSSGGKLYDIPADKLAGFLSKRKDAVPATEEEILKKEDERLKNAPSTPREANIQNDPAPSPGIFNSQALEIPKSEGLRPFSGLRPLSEQTGEVFKRDQRDVNRQFKAALNEYGSYRDWIDEVNRDETLSPGAKRELNEWYAKNVRTGENSAEAGRLPSFARDYLDKNKEEVEGDVYIPSQSMFGGGVTTKGKVTKNTQEQRDLINDFLANSPVGQDYVKWEEEQSKALDDSIDALKAKIAEAEKTGKKVDTSIYVPGSPMFGGGEHKTVSRPENYKDINTAKSELLKLEMLREAVKQEGSGFASEFFGELGRRGGEAAINAGTLGVSKALYNKGLGNVSEDPENKLTREVVGLKEQYQNFHSVDRSIAQDIARGTTDNVDFVTQFAFTGGIASFFTKGMAKIIAGRLGGNYAAKAIGAMAEDVAAATVRAATMPTTIATAYEINMQNPGSFLDAYSQAFGQIWIEAKTEAMGAHLPGLSILGRKSKTVRKLMERTGVQGYIPEFIEEQMATVLHSAAGNGQGSWSDLVDPRNQIITAGTVAIMQVPYTSISAGGYAAGKARNIQQKRSIRKGYETNVGNMQSVFGEEGKEIAEYINGVIDTNGESDNIHYLISNIINDEEMSDQQKDAAVKYALSYSAYSGLERAKTEAVETAVQDAVETINSNVNPDMGAIAYATVNGSEEPMLIVGGNIVLTEEGEIDKENSSKELYYTDKDGKKQVVSIDFIENPEIIPAEAAAQEATNIVSSPIIAQQENDEVRPYEQGETVTFSQDGNTMLSGQIAGIDEAGNYIVQVETPQGVMPLPVEPRHILNEDNLRGVDNGSIVRYRNEAGELMQGEVEDAYTLRQQGLVTVDGQEIPVANVIGLAEEAQEAAPEVETEEQTQAKAETVENEQIDSNLPEISAENEEAPGGGDSNVSEEEQKKQQIAQIEQQAPRRKNGRVDYTALLDANPEAFSLLWADRSGTENAKQQLQKASVNIGQRIESEKKKADKEIDINKIADIEDKIAELNKRKKGIDAVIEGLRPESVEAPTTEDSVTPGEISSENDRLTHIAQNSNDIQEIASAYEEAMQSAGEETLQEWEKQLIGRRVNRASFENFGDRNYITGTIARFWFNRKGEEGTTGSIDTIAEELGVDVQDIVDFIVSHPANRVKKGNEITSALNDRFKEVASGIAGEQVGGIESASGRMLLRGIEIATERQLSQEEMREVDKVVPDSLLILFEAMDVDLEKIDTFEELESLIEESKSVLWQLSEDNYSEINDFISYAKRNEEYSATSERIKEAAHIRSALPNLSEQQDQSEEGSAEGAERQVGFTSEFEGSPITRVEGLGMGQNQAEGVYVSYEPENRYATEENPARRVEISINNPARFDQNSSEFSEFQQGVLSSRLPDFSVTDFESFEISETPTIDNLSESGVRKLAGFVTDELQSAGHDAIVFEGEGEHEIVVFDSQNVRNAEVASVAEEARKTEEGKPVDIADSADKTVKQQEITTDEARRIVEGKGEFEQLKALEEYARENGVWIEDTSALGEQIGKGGENEVFHSPGSNSVFKVNGFNYSGTNAANLFDRIDAHNTLFPHTKYTIVGFAKNSEGNVSVVIEQPFVKKADKPATTERIADYMQSIGFDKVDGITYANQEYVVSDATPNNVILGADGRLYPVDPNIRKKPVDIVALAHKVAKQHEIAQEEAKVDTEPTEAQKEAGNYKKGHVKIHGFDISIEQPKGSVRSGKDASGKEWSVEMQNTYGYIRGTEGRDRDHIDVFVGPNPTSEKVFVVDQVDPSTGKFDEHKTMLAFDSIEEAKAAYLSNYEKDWQGLGGITETTVEAFKEWAGRDGRRVKPFAEYKQAQSESSFSSKPQAATIRFYDGREITGNVVSRESGKITVESNGKTYTVAESRIIDGSRKQETKGRFKPIGRRAFEKLIKALKKTGLASGVVVDQDKFETALEEALGKTKASRFLILWHGTPHVFKQFSTSYMGTGEGVQAFGWGLYFTERRDIAEWYAKKLLPEKYQENAVVNKLAKDALESSNGNVKEALVYQNELLEADWSDKKRVRRVIKVLETGKPLSEGKSNVYKVSTSEDMSFIRWDESVPENQINAIKDLAKSENLKDRWGRSVNDEGYYPSSIPFSLGISGEGIYKQLQKEFDMSPKDVSLFLLRAGIDGIQYPAESSSGRGSRGGFNYVVFDGDAADIQEKIRLMSSPAGTVYGFVTPDGTIYLDPTKMNANTPIHEFGHLWNSFIKESNPELWEKGKALVVQSPYWKQVNENPAYSSLSEDQKVDEALAMAIGDKGEAIVQSKNIISIAGIKTWIRDAWNWIRQQFRISEELDIENMTLSDFTDLAVGQLLSGESIVGSGEISQVVNDGEAARAEPTESESKESVLDWRNRSTRFQGVNEPSEEDIENVRKQLDIKLNKTIFRLREAWEDKYLAVKEFLDVLRDNGTEIAEYNDYYLQATHVAGKNDAQLAHYNNEYQKPLNKAIADFEKIGINYRSIENYAILKHGLERNEFMRNKAINEYMASHPEASQEQIDAFIEGLPEDYSGITEVQEEVGMSAEDFISEFENKAKNLIDNFWEKVRAATRFSLKKQYEGGMIGKKLLDELTERYQYYIPLRGHDAETAEDRWNYAPETGTYFVNPIMKANGRRSRSETPFAFIAQAAQSSINSANKNILNQTLLRLARNDKTKLLVANKTWFVQTDLDENGNPAYEMREPAYSENREQYQKNIEEFEEKMFELAEKGLAVQKGGKFDIGKMFIKPKQEEQHAITVYQNGTPYNIYVNANPAVSRAVNGLNAKDLHKDIKYMARMSRQMAANFTTRNPAFVLSNFSRDYLFASSILPVKEGAKYAMQFHKNTPKAADALQRYIRGKGDPSKIQDRYVSEYILNGGKTGFSHILELQTVQKQIEREIKKGDKKNAVVKFISGLESCNEFVENLSRFSVYMTSREQGRSIIRSISDAKEVTVNFNRSGAGGYGSQWIRPLYLFVNAGIQALSNFAKVASKNKGKTAALVSTYAMSGFIMPFVAQLLGGDDGYDEYMKLSEWERQNNLCLYTGKGFVKIPLPHELRVFHKLGDNVFQSIFADKDATDSLTDTVLGFADLIPANPTGAIEASWAELFPDFVRPLMQLASNKNFTGNKIVNEWVDPNTPGYLKVRTNKKGDAYAPSFLVKLAELSDNATGGDGVEKGLVGFNPDVADHLMKGYFGGMYTMAIQGINIVEKTYDFSRTGELKIKSRDIPIGRSFYVASDDLLTTSSGLNTKYYKVSEEVQEIRRKIKGYENQAKEGKIGIDKFASKLQELDVERAGDISARIQSIKEYEKLLKEVDGEEQKSVERIIAQLKQEVIEVNKLYKENKDK